MRNSLTIISPVDGSYIPTTRLLRTEAYQRRAKEATHHKWGPEEWERCLDEAEKEIDKGITYALST